MIICIDGKHEKIKENMVKIFDKISLIIKLNPHINFDKKTVKVYYMNPKRRNEWSYLQKNVFEKNNIFTLNFSKNWRPPLFLKK